MTALLASGSIDAEAGRPQPALPISEPVVFDTFTGVYQAAPGGTGDPVLMLSPFGFEELCSRRFWTALSESLAAAGIASLRFDLPGTANALDVEPSGLDDWRDATVAAATALRARTGRDRITILGQGLGGALALQWAGEIAPLSSLVLLEPVSSGRAYLRGLKAWGASIAAAAGLMPSAAEKDSHAVAGFALSGDRIAAIRDLDLGMADVPDVAAILVLEQPGGGVGKRLERHLGTYGIDVLCRAFPGYAALITDPTSAVVPVQAIASIMEWLSSRPVATSPSPQSRAFPARTIESSMLVGDGFAERPIRFGPGSRLAGVLCLPQTSSTGESAVVIANAGRDYSIGWARAAVSQARSLARQGIASLRFDVGGIGDSRPAADAPDEILYSTAMCDDLRAAVDHLDGLGYRSLGLMGRCSGAWAAFTLAAEDERIGSLALVNIGYFLWDPTRSLADVIRFAQRSVGDLGATMFKRNGFRRLIRGQLDLRGAARFLARQVNLHVLRPCAPLLGPLTAESRRYHHLHAMFGKLRTRKVRLLLAYSEGDSSLAELQGFMGRRLAGLKRYPNVAICAVKGADHNFTPEPANAELTSRLVAFFEAGAASARNTPNPSAARLCQEPYGFVPSNA